MTHRLLINPGTPQAWEIQLKPGANRIGRGDHNDFQVAHGSVSGTHCEIVVSSAGVILKDLGSTNGCFVNRAPVKEAILQTGQHLQLGSVDMVFESAAPGGTASPAAAPIVVRLSSPTAAAGAPPTAPPVPVTARPTSLRFSGAGHAAAAPTAEPIPEAIAETEPTGPPPAGAPKIVGMAFCKFHPKTPARFFCNKCRKFFCDLCVSTRASSAGSKKTCRACGVEVTPVLIERGAGGGGKTFYARLPGAMVYPFQGMGVFYMLIAAVVFSALRFVGGGITGIFITAAAYGFLFLFMQNIIHTTASDENTTLELPSGGDLGGGFVSLLGTIVMSFWLYIILWVCRYKDIDVPGAALIGAKILGCLYCPMAILAIAMKDSVIAGNPLVVLPAILRMPLEYAVTTLVLLGAYGVNEFGDNLKFGAAMDIMTTKDMGKLFAAFGVQAVLAFMTIYLLTASMRVLALLYVTKKQKFGWFAH
ncbi:MAG: FHA domain-containing protein [Pedosphaera sp.]|nr:FHA domain-containing protein [Pedosphaera sp.]